MAFFRPALFALTIAFPATPWTAQAQAPTQFEVASIRPHAPAPDEPSNRRVLPGGRYMATNTTVRTLLRMTFGMDDKRMFGAPSWIDNEPFDITAVTADHAEIKTPEELQKLILALLEERFQLKYHRATAEGPVFWLELDKPGKPGPGLKPSDPAVKAGMSVNGGGGKMLMRVSQTPMSGIASALSRQLGRPVEDHTGLKGNYDYLIQWSTEDAPDASDPSLFTVMKEQLGIKVKSTKGTFETLVIDQISHPSEN